MRKMLVILLLLSVIMGCATQQVEQVEEQKKVVPGVTDTEVKIGSSAPLSGHASFLGTQLLEGSMAYINEVNANGGVHGRQIKVIQEDDLYDPPKTLENTKKLIDQDKVFALFDYVGTPTSKAVVVTETPIHDAKTPLLGLFTGAGFLRNPLQPYVFNIRDSYNSEAEGAIAYFVTNLGFENVAIMYQNDAFGAAVLSGVKAALERRGMELVAEATFERGTMDVEDGVASLKDSGAEAIVMVGTYSPLAKFIKLCNDAEFTPYFHTVSFIGSEAFGKELVEVQEVDPEQYSKIIVTQVVPAPFSDEYDTVKEYKELATKYNPDHEPNYVALEGFVNAKVLVKALTDSGQDLTRENFLFALESMQKVNVGIGKSVSFNKDDHQGLEGIYYSRLSEGGVFKIFNPII